MKRIKRTAVSVLLLFVLMFSLLQLSGCYTIKSGKMRRVEGTYELTGYSTDKDEIEANGIKLYIVIRLDGTGYYAYTDNDTPVYFAELNCRFTQDPEKSGYYSYVELNFTGKNDAWYKLGINAGWRIQNLNSNQPKYAGNIFDGTYGLQYYINVDFNRVSKKTDVSYLTKIFGEHRVNPLGSTQLNGVYFYSGASSENAEFPSAEFETPFVYAYLNVDIYREQGEIWYMLKSDEVEKNEKFDLHAAMEDGVYVLYLGSARAPFGLNAPYYSDMKIPVTLTVGEAEYEGAYEFHLAIELTVEDIPENIEAKKNTYEWEKNSPVV